MLMTDIICKKRDGEALTKDEIGFFVKGYVSGEIPDYQASALCMAIYFRGMNDDEILDLTLAMMNSGETVDLSGIEGIKADKHSTGGVGKIDVFELWCWRRSLRVPWTARRSNQSTLKEVNTEYSLEGLMLKLKLQYSAA